MQIARQNILFTSNVAPVQITKQVTAAEKTLLQHADLVAILDAKRVAYDRSNYIVDWVSRKPSGINEQLVSTGGLGTVTGNVYYPTTDGQFGVRSGYNNAGTVNGNYTSMVGNTYFVIPTTWLIAELAAHDVPASSQAIWSTADPTTQLSRITTSDGRVRRYTDFSATFTQSATGFEDGALALWEDVWDGTNWISYKNRTQIFTAAPVMPSLPDRRIRLNSVNNAGSIQNLMKGYRELFIIGAPTASLRTAIKAVVAERHPGLVLA